jgi:hypothetical protein
MVHVHFRASATVIFSIAVVDFEIQLMRDLGVKIEHGKALGRGKASQRSLLVRPVAMTFDALGYVMGEFGMRCSLA